MPARTRVAEAASNPPQQKRTLASSSRKQPTRSVPQNPPSDADQQIETSRREARTASNNDLRASAIAGSSRRTIAKSQSVTSAKSRSVPTKKTPVASTSFPLLSEADILLHLREVNLEKDNDGNGISSHTITSLQRHLQDSTDSLALCQKAIDAALVSYRSLHTAGWKASACDGSKMIRRVEHLIESSMVAIRHMMKTQSPAEFPTSMVAKVIGMFKRRIAIGMSDNVIKDLAVFRRYFLPGDKAASSDGKAPADELRLAAELLAHPQTASFPIPSLQTLLDTQITTVNALMLHTIPPSKDTLTSLAALVTSIRHPTDGSIASSERVKTQLQAEAQLQPFATRLLLCIVTSTTRLSSQLSALKTPLIGEHKLPHSQWVSTLFQLQTLSIIATLKQRQYADDTVSPEQITATLTRLERAIRSYWKECEATAAKNAAVLEISSALREDVHPLVSRLEWTGQEGWVQILKRWRQYARAAAMSDTVTEVSILIDGQDSPELVETSQPKVADSVTAAIPLLPACKAAEELLMARYHNQKDQSSSSTQEEEIRILDIALQAMQSYAASPSPFPPSLYISLDNTARLCDRLMEQWSHVIDVSSRQTRFDFQRLVLQCMSILLNRGDAGSDNNDGYTEKARIIVKKMCRLSYTTPTSLKSEDPMQSMPDCQALLDKCDRLSRQTRHELCLQIADDIWKDGIASYRASGCHPAVEICRTSATLEQIAMRFASPEKITRAWEKWYFVGDCYSRLSRSQESFEAMHVALRCVPMQRWEQLASEADGKSLEDVFSAEDNLKGLLQKLAQVSILDVLIPQHSTPHGTHRNLIDMLAKVQDGRVPTEAQAVCLEYLSMSGPLLKPRLHLKLARDAFSAFMHHADDLTDEAKMPIRKARRMMPIMEMDVLSGREDGSIEEEMVRIEECLNKASVHPAQDLALAYEIPRLTAEVNLWGILALHRNAAAARPEEYGLHAEMARKASEALRPFVDTSAVTKPKVSTTSSQLRANKPLKTRSVNVTPPRGNRTGEGRKPGNASRAVTGSIHDAADHAGMPASREVSKALGPTIVLLEQACDYLVASGHILPAIELLQRLRSITRPDTDMYARACSQLAQQYLSLGDVSRADSILSPLLADTKSTHSPESRFALLTTQVQVLCSLSVPEKAAKLYEEAVQIADALHRDIVQAGKENSASRGSLALRKVSHYVRAQQAALAYSMLASANGDLAAGVSAALLAVRESSEAAESVGKIIASLEEKPQKTGSDDEGDADGDVFSSPVKSAAPSQQEQTAKDVERQAVVVSGPDKPARTSKAPVNLLSQTIAGMHWRTVQAYAHSRLNAASLLQAQGSAPDALAQLDGLLTFSEGLQLNCIVARTLLCRASLLFKMQRDENAKVDVERVKGMLPAQSDAISLEIVMLPAVRAQYLASRPKWEVKERAVQVYDAATQAADVLKAALCQIAERTSVDVDNREGEARKKEERSASAPAKARPTTRKAATAAPSKTPASTRSANATPRARTVVKKVEKPGQANQTDDSAKAVRSTSPAAAAATSASKGANVLFQLLIEVLCEKATLLYALGQHTESQELIEQRLGSKAAAASDAMALLHLTLAELSRNVGLQGMSNDPLWGLVAETVLSLPIGGTSVGLSRALSTCSKSVVDAFVTAEHGFQQALQSRSRSAIHLRRALIGLASTSIVDGMVKPCSKTAYSVVSKRVLSSLGFMDRAACVTLQSQFAQAISSKFEQTSAPISFSFQVSRFIRLSPTRGIEPASSMATGRIQKLQSGRVADRAVRQRSESPISISSDEDDDADDAEFATQEDIHEAFWKAKRAAVVSSTEGKSLQDKPLPAGWTVVTMTVSTDRKSLLLGRRSSASSSRIFSLPFARSADENDEEDDGFTIDAAQSELADIVSSSNQLSTDASHIVRDETREKTREWWDQRRALDTQLKQLCEDIEQKWLGPFKGLFGSGDDVGGSLMASAPMRVFKKNLQRVIEKACVCSVGTPQRGSKSTSSASVSSASASPVPSLSGSFNTVKIEDGIFEMMANLAKVATSDEELEDLLTYLMELYQFNGVPVALDEVDLDLLVIDLRSALDELRAGMDRLAGNDEDDTQDDSHVFLILDKDTCGFPWESIPCLRGKAVCRIPSLSFLHDRVDLARRLGASQSDDGSFHLSSNPKAYYLLNPSGDLSNTQERFTSYLTQSRTPTWKGIMGRPPIADEFVNALASEDLVMYFGHGGGSRYARPTRIRSLKRCAVTMLWGCSSALLSSQGEFDPTGTPHTYMCANSPCLIGQLFDATDKELDSIAESVLIKSRLKDGHSASQGLVAARKASTNRVNVKENFVDKGVLVPERGTRTMSLARAVAQSRDSCRLPYLTGAATVVWGVPVYFDR